MSEKKTREAGFNEVAQQLREQRSLEVDLFRLNGFESYFKKKLTREKITEICCVGSGVKYQTRAVVFTRNKHTTVSRRMEAAGSTPTKSFSRLSFVPKSKKSICLLYGEYIDNTDKWRKPFDGGVKTQICINLDRIFALGSRNLRSGPILAASIHSLLRGRAQIRPNTVSHASAATANFGRNAD